MSKPRRSQRSDGSVTRARILESAGELFATLGLASTTSKAIAARADVDLASINYHFGNRDGLYQAVLVEAHRRFITLEELEGILAQPTTPDAKRGLLINAIVDRVSGQAHWGMTVLARELGGPSEHFAVLRDEEVPPKFLIVLQILSEVTGIPVGAPELLCCLISVAAPCAMLLIVGANLPTPGNNVLLMDRKALADHLYRFALAGLQAAGQNYRTTVQGDEASSPARKSPASL